MDTKKLVIYKNGRYVEVAGSGGGGGAGLTKVTHAELLALRDAGQLVPGAKYRITDYECIIADSEEFRAVSHPFDIIVTADSESSLNENCSATLHEGDEYFKNCQLESWELKYSIDNGARLWGKLGGLVVSAPGFGDVGIKTNRTAEFDGETYDVWEITPTVSSVLGVAEMYVLAGQTPTTTDECFIDAFGEGVLFSITEAAGMSLPLTTSQGAGGKGVIYWMKDNLGNEAYYDFKGVQINGKGITGLGGEDIWLYTFSCINMNPDDTFEIYDDTIYPSLAQARGNILKGEGSISQLNKTLLIRNVSASNVSNIINEKNVLDIQYNPIIIFHGSFNEIGYNSNGVLFNSSGNKIGDSCGEISLHACFDCVVGSGCYGIDIYYAERTIFGNGCSHITRNLDYGAFDDCSFGNQCQYINFEPEVTYASNLHIVNGCSFLRLKSNMYDVTIHKGVHGESESDPLELTIPSHTGEYNIVAAGSVTKEV